MEPGCENGQALDPVLCYDTHEHSFLLLFRLKAVSHLLDLVRTSTLEAALPETIFRPTR